MEDAPADGAYPNNLHVPPISPHPSTSQAQPVAEPHASAQAAAMQRRTSAPAALPVWYENLLTKLTNTVVDLKEDKDTASPGKGPDARSPDKFDGVSPSKLRPFLAQCRLVFLNHSKRFKTDRAKVLYAGSYLTGVAADWFEPFTRDAGEEALVLDDWTLFTERIEQVFGDSNAIATAEHRLDTLRMRENDQISSYITRFRTNAAELHWDDAPLRYAFRKGLADRILDELARRDDPEDLSNLIEVSLKIDNRYWERQREKKLYPRATSRAVDSDSRPPSALPKDKRNFDHHRRSPAHTTRSPARPINAERKPLDRVLNKEGKLNASEKARRAEKGLCNYCGGPHKLEACPVRPQQNSAARIAASPSAALSVVAKN